MDSTPKLIPAKDLAARAMRAYPNDSDEYRKARIALLAEEIELRRHITRVAAQRRALPLGGKAKDYRFRDDQGKELGLADLFGRHDTLVTYAWMYGPERERPCPMCTSFLGSLDVPSVDIRQRVAFAVLGRSPVARQLAFARERGWRNLAFYEIVGDDFSRDYRVLARRRQRMGRARRLGAQGRRRPPLLGSRDHDGDGRPRPGPAPRARAGTAVDDPRSHARRPRHRLVSEAVVRGVAVRGGALAGAPPATGSPAPRRSPPPPAASRRVRARCAG